MTSTDGRTVYLDLDGPVLDVSARYYAVHRHLCASASLDGGELARFWAAKRERVLLAALLATEDPEQIRRYREAWTALIETDEYLALDRLQPGAHEAVARLGERFRVVIVTLRQDEERVRQEIARLVPQGHIHAIRCGSPLLPCGEEVKAGLFREDMAHHKAVAAIGDTEIDIRAGKAAGLRTVAVLNGIRCERLLLHEQPDLIVGDLGEAVSALLV